MGSHDPFEYLKHKLWLKKGLGIKVSIWIPTIKSWESLWITCVKEACHVSLEIFWQGLQLCFGPHFNQRFSQEIMGVQSGGSPNFRNCGTLDLGILRKMPFGCSPHGESQKILQGGKVVVSPKFRPWWVLLVRVCTWFVHAPKMFQLCTNQLVVWFIHTDMNTWHACHFP
jgi:hypothetical protein